MKVPALAGVLLVLAYGCGGGAAATPAPRPSSGTPASAAASPLACSGSVGSPVAIANFTFTPGSASVAVGGVVTWANADTATHTVTFDDGPDCGRLNQGGTVSRTFDAPGTFAYHCAIHTTMKGTVVVQ